jgi:hypothetical protein
MDWIFLVNASSSPGLLERLKIPFDLFELKVRGSYLLDRFTYLQVGYRFTLTRSGRCLFLSSLLYLPRYKVGLSGIYIEDYFINDHD